MTVALGFVRVDADRPQQQRLADTRHQRERASTERIVLDRNVAPRDHIDRFRATRFLDDALEIELGGVVHDEDHADADPLRFDLRQPEPGGLRGEETAGDRDEQPCPVARLGVGCDGAAMADVAERADGRLDHATARAPLGVGDEADAAGVPLRTGVPTHVRSRLPGERAVEMEKGAPMSERLCSSSGDGTSVTGV